MSDANLRLGVVGCGWAGQEGMRAARALAGVELTAISELDPARRAEAAEAHGAQRQYGDYRELLADNEVEAVYLAVNPVMRHQMVLDAFAAGKHTLVQKPHALRAERILEYDKAAGAAGKILQFCFFQRHDPQNRRIRAAIARGDIGEPYHGRTFIQYNTRPAPEGITRWLQTYGQKGGVLGEHASHDLDMAWWWMGCPEPEWAFATKHVVDPLYDGPEGPAEDYFSGLVGLAGGRTLQVECTRSSHAEAPTLVEVHGTDGAIRNGQLSRFVEGQGFVTAEVDAPLDVPCTEEPADKIWLYHEIEHFVLAVAGQVEPDVNARDSYQFMRILDALYDSALTEEKVVLCSPPGLAAEPER